MGRHLMAFDSVIGAPSDLLARLRRMAAGIPGPRALFTRCRSSLREQVAQPRTQRGHTQFEYQCLFQNQTKR